jgi:AraC family transcriptional regulator
MNARTDTQRDYAERILRVLLHIQAHLDEPLDLDASHDDPDVTPPEKLRYDACITVGEDVEPAGNVGVQTVAGGRYAVTTHVGPYAGLADTYGLPCGQWLPAQNLEPAADRPALEFYVDDPETTPEAELRTEIYVPVEDG